MNFKIEAPKIPALTSLETVQIDFLQSKEEITRCIISDCIIEGQEASKVSFDKVLFKNVTFVECSLPGIELTDTLFENCDLSNVDFSGAFVHRTVFQQCRMVGTDFADARFQNVRVLESLGDMAAFRFANLKQVAFEHCSLLSADYYQSVLHSLAFSGCKLDQATFSGSRLKGIDLSDCDFTGLHVEIEDLNGCIISAQQAASFAGLLGLVIK
ncbi:quinolone resistance protein [Paenibacillus albidus]|uniref:Quinolone resistance protein n=1 Tax=Paenibacillus albidus TaxID=2041023 RepID=A0A917FWD4_9BACL|nr:pentapeptide repeat-containing protein [Paenibacillus albidus]GGG11186.1 quinolone resistance protein [Paenibacillus albidus]